VKVYERLSQRKLTSRSINLDKIPRDEYPRLIDELTGQMQLASANLEFEKAAELRDLIADINSKLDK
jgi:excinuclease ABC subunit B